jgi:hypothetical protein
MRFDHTRKLVQLALRVALGRGHAIAFVDAKRLADLRLGNLAQAVKVEDVHAQILRV